MNLQKMVLAYFVIGATLWAGGAIAYEDSGMATLFVEVEDGVASGNNQTAENISEAGGPLQEAAQGAQTGLIAVWNLFINLIGFLFWPITTLTSLSAPVEVVVLLGGAPTVAFYGSIFRVLRQSA